MSEHESRSRLLEIYYYLIANTRSEPVIITRSVEELLTQLTLEIGAQSVSTDVSHKVNSVKAVDKQSHLAPSHYRSN